MKLNGKFFIEVFMSKKGNKCACLKVDLVYARKAVSFDSCLIAEMLGISVVELMGLEVGTYNV